MTRVTRKSLAAAEETVSPTLLELLPAFRIHLQAENKGVRTIEAYCEAVRRLDEFLVNAEVPTDVGGITKEMIVAFQADQVKRLSPASAKTRYASLRQFFKWVVAEHQTEAWWGRDRPSPMADMSPPRVPDQPVPILQPDQVQALLKFVDRQRDFFGRRDCAIVRLFLSTGARLSEVANLTVEDVDMRRRKVTFHGKGGRDRTNPITPEAARALDKYMGRTGVRRRHPDAELAALWLGGQGQMTADGIAEAVKRRARQAGVGDIHVHMLRHTVAHLLRLRGYDDDATLHLMGWSVRSRDMLHRYGSSAADQRAHEAYGRLGVADGI